MSVPLPRSRRVSRLTRALPPVPARTPTPTPPPPPRATPRPTPAPVSYPRYKPRPTAAPAHGRRSPVTYVLLITVPAIAAVAALRPR